MNIFIFQNPHNSKHKLPPLLNYEHLAPPPVKTRTTSTEGCKCPISLIAKQNLNYSAYADLQSNKVGAPQAKTLPVCSKCWGEIGKGIPHNCQKSTKRDNLSNIVRNTSGKSKSKVASSTLKSLAEEQGVSSRGGVIQLETGSKPIPVQVGTPKVKPKDPKFSHENLKRLQTANNLSDKTML